MINAQGDKQVSLQETIPEEFYSFFNGKEDIAGGGETYALAIQWLVKEPSSFHKKCIACAVFSLKPMVFLLTGKTKSGKGDGVAVSEKLRPFLPYHEDGWLQDLAKGSASDKVTFKNRTSAKFPDWMRSVNASMIKCSALLYFEATEFNAARGISLPSKIAMQWHDAYGVAPSSLTLDVKDFADHPETYKIRSEQLSQFKKGRRFWIKDLSLLAGLADPDSKFAQQSPSTSSAVDPKPPAPTIQMPQPLQAQPVVEVAPAGKKK